MWGLTPDQVEQELQREEESIARSRGRQMLLLAAADAMQLQTADGCSSFREWAAGRLDISVESASTLTATARRLLSAPQIAQQLLEGKITFDRAEAMARIPGAGEDDDLGGVDIRGLHQIAARHRRITRDDCHDSHRSQYLAIQPNLDESTWKMWALLDGYSGAVVDKVLTEAADQVPPLPDGIRPGLGYRRAVALAAICEESRPGAASTPLITVFVDEDGAEIAAGTSIGAPLLDRIACSANLEVIRTDDGQPLAVGRRTRVIPNRLRRFILHRDGACTGDGCTSRYRLEAHHIIPWSEGGPTDPENLTTLCWFHHHVVVHGWGYRIDPRLGSGRLRFIKPGAGPP
jgi:hypothetical protein